MSLLKWIKTALLSTAFLLAMATLLVVSPVLSFQSDTEPIPAATLTPTSTANIRNLPSIKGTEVVAKAATGTHYPVLGFVTRDDGKWYDLSLPEGGYGWVRSDVVPAPEGDELWDLTEVAAVPVLNDDAQLPEQLVDMNINLALVKSAFDTLMSRGATVEIFTPDNIRLIGIQGENLIFQLRNAVQTSEAGTLLTIIGNENGAQDEALFSPVQLRDLLGKNGVQVDGEFEVSKSSDPYLWLGRTVLFNYEQATSQLSQGTDVEEALLASAVVSDTPFPDTLFSVSKTDTGTQIVFITGRAYDLLQNEGEHFLRAKKLDTVIMTPFVVATQLGLPQGNYTFDMNAAYGPNKMLKDATGNVVAVSNVEGDVWQTAETVVQSLRLDTQSNLDEGDVVENLNYFFWTDQGNIFLREKRDELHQRGLQAMLGEKDGVWLNLREVQQQMYASPSDFQGLWENTQGEHFIEFDGVSFGLRTDLQVSFPLIEGKGNIFIRVFWFHHTDRRDSNYYKWSMETALVALGVQFQGTEIYMDGFGKVDYLATKGLKIIDRIPLEPFYKKGILTLQPSEFYQEIYQEQNLQYLRTKIKNNEVMDDPVLMLLYLTILSPEPFVLIPIS